MSDTVIKLEQKDLDALVNRLGEDANVKINELFGKAEQGNATALKEVREMIMPLMEIEGKSMGEYVKTVQDHANRLEAELKQVKEQPQRGASFHEILAKDVKAKHEEFKNAFASRRSYELKTVGDMSVTDNLGAGVVQPLYLQGVNPIAKRRTTLYDILNKVPWASDTVYYVENSAAEGTIAARKEAAASLAGDYDTYAKFPQKDYDFVRRSMTLSKIPVYAKVTKEMMENADNVVSFIQNELVRDLLLQLENDILKGNGTAPNMKGLQHSDHYTAAAVPGDYTLPSGVTPSEVDVLRAIITQMYNGYFSPGVILMHPTDTMKLDLARDENGQFLIPPFASRDNTTIKGVPIVEHANLTAGTFHIIDPNRVNLYIQRGMSLQLWDQVGSDPLYDLMTMTASVKAAPLVKYNDKAANIYGTFATLITAMTAGS